jgi:Spy/CpxP family protein refolding chaperone
VKRWWLWIVLLLSLGVNVGILTTLAVDHLRRDDAPLPASAGGPLRPGPRFQNLADRLGLEGERRERFLAIQQRAFERMRAERQRLMGARLALRRELVSGSSDRARIDTLLAEVTAAQAALERALIDSLLETREVLDPEQQRMYLRFVEERLRPGEGAARERRPMRERPRRQRP